MAVTFEMMMEYHISYNIWCAKALEGVDAAYSVSFCGPDPKGWRQIVDYCAKGTAKPGYAKAIKIFDELLENIKLENCTEQKDRVAAMLRRPGIRVLASGYDTDQEYSGTWPYALYCGYRREDRMHLVYEPGYMPNDLGGLAMMNPHPEKYGDYPHIWLRLEEGDCASYTVREAKEPVSVRLYGMAAGENQIRVFEGEKIIFEGSVPVSNEITAIPAGKTGSGERVVIKIEAVSGSVVLKTVEFC